MMNILCWPAIQVLSRLSINGQRTLTVSMMLAAIVLASIDSFVFLTADWQSLPVILLVLLAYLLASQITLYLQQHQEIESVIRSLANRQLDARLGFKPRKGFHPLTLKLNTVGREYQRMNHAIGSCAGETQFTARELESTSKEMAQCAEEQHRRLESAAAAAEQITATMSEIAVHVEQAQQNAVDSQSSCREGQACSLMAVEEIQKVVDEVSQTEHRLRHLKERSDEINTVTASIESISQQINLLALNASIEAARAGEAGRGFAVVADEIRNLAQSTKDATGNISTLLESVSEETDSAFEGITDSQQRVSNSVAKVQETQQSLEQIYQGALQTSEGVKSVSHSIREHVQVSEEMAQTLETIAQLSQRTRRSTEQTEDMVYYLKDLSRKLGQIVVPTSS
ncbi:MAG: methyl-accepting chemotaxis protein [Motiliproteus sp.]|nr:methyl-accepting chemotaxis protein [Motiliproteus sp.]MCW9050958.1 methyl-accepting chemotaxis protein [Motiliproteus sp.]